MPSYALVCRFDDSVILEKLRTDKKKLCLSTDVEDQLGNKKDSIIGTATDIQSGTILHWSDKFQIKATDKNGKESSKFDITYRQAFTFTASTKSVGDDDKAPSNGFIFRLDDDAKVSLYQKFGGDEWGLCHEKTYKKGDNVFRPPLVVGIWFEAADAGDTSTVTWDQKFHIDFTNSFSQTAYYNSKGVWNLVGPDSYASGALLSLTKGKGGYVVSQVPNRDFSLPPTKANGPRKEFTIAITPIVLLNIYIDTSTFEAGLEVTILGISIGSLYGNVKEGLVLHINLALVSGQVSLSLRKNGSDNELWAAAKVHFVGDFHTEINEEVKVLTF
ncbi:hypothetical protein MMC30_001074 [Trapelia coarctata]|nr:hypothetical protein [Trapelia coarctata]